MSNDKTTIHSTKFLCIIKIVFILNHVHATEINMQCKFDESQTHNNYNYPGIIYYTNSPQHQDLVKVLKMT